MNIDQLIRTLYQYREAHPNQGNTETKVKSFEFGGDDVLKIGIESVEWLDRPNGSGSWFRANEQFCDVVHVYGRYGNGVERYTSDSGDEQRNFEDYRWRKMTFPPLPKAKA